MLCLSVMKRLLKYFLVFTLLFVMSSGSFARIVKASNSSNNSAAKVANLLEEASKNFRDKNYQYSVSVYKQALLLDDSNPGIHFGLGACYLALKDYPLAVEYLQRAIELNPALVEAYFSLALAYQGLSQPNQSLKVYRQGLGLDLSTGLPRSTFSNQVTISNSDDNYQNKQSEEKLPKLSKFNKLSNDNSTSLDILESKEESPELVIEQDASSKTDAGDQYTFGESSKQKPLNVYETSENTNEEDYFLKQIIELNTELKNNPNDYQTKFKLGIFYAKAKMYNNAQSIVQELSLNEENLAEELKQEIEQIKKSQSQNSQVPIPPNNPINKIPVNTSQSASSIPIQKQEANKQTQKQVKTFDSPYQKRKASRRR